MIVLNALARVRGDSYPVIVQGVDMERALVIHGDGSIGAVPLKDVQLNALEVAVRFSELQKYNANIMEEAREHME